MRGTKIKQNKSQSIRFSNI